MIRRGDVHRGGRSFVLVVQAQPYNDSRLPTVLAAVLTANTALAAVPGNVFLAAAVTGLAEDLVVDVTGLMTLAKSDLGDSTATLPAEEMDAVDRGLRRVLGLTVGTVGARAPGAA